MAFTLPKLPYAYDALEPHIDARTMEIHYTKHHNAYLTKLNAALDGAGVTSDEAEKLISDLNSVPESIRGAVRNNGGGYVNHTFFWDSMAANAGGAPEGDLAEAVNKAFGDFDGLKKTFGDAAAARFGSGWAWIVADKDGLSVISTPNQDNPMMEGKTAILGLDVWEHAYYLNYQNRRPDYVAAWWNVVDWKKVAERWKTASSAVAVA